MAEYALRTKIYSPPDRGDPKGGWYPKDYTTFEAETDDAAMLRAREHIALECKGRSPAEILSVLTRVIPFEIALH